ncbi:MAG: glycosyltransferase family 9 protein [Candidatus Omnitrophota bacterium]
MAKKINPDDVKKVLVISLSNLGDIILTFPVIDILRRDFAQADLSVMIGPRGKSLLIDNPKVDHLYIYDKHMGLRNKIRWIAQLRKEKFDLIVDLRHGILPLILRTKYRTPLIRRRILDEHYRDQHLRYLYAVHPAHLSNERYAFYPLEKDVDSVKSILREHFQPEDPIAVMAPGAADHRKRWTEDGFAKVADQLAQQKGLHIVFVGSENDSPIISRIMARMQRSALDLSGKISFPQTGIIMRLAKIVIANDSSAMHLASYLGVPLIALYGPTNPVKSGPWGNWSGFIQHNEDCMACCEKIPDAEHSCMNAIQPAEVIAMAERLMNPSF